MDNNKLIADGMVWACAQVTNAINILMWKTEFAAKSTKELAENFNHDIKCLKVLDHWGRGIYRRDSNRS